MKCNLSISMVISDEEILEEGIPMLLIILLIICCCLLIVDILRFLRGAHKTTLTFWIMAAILFAGYRRKPEKYFQDIEKEIEQ